MKNRGALSLRRLMLVVAACLLLPGVALAAATTFKGKTSQGRQVTVEIARGKVIKKGSIIHWRAACTNTITKKHTYPITASTDFGGKVKHGRFAASGKYTSYPGGPTNELNTATVHFKLSGKKITGTFSLSAKIYYEGTNPPTLNERCQTGTIHFTAKR